MTASRSSTTARSSRAARPVELTTTATVAETTFAAAAGLPVGKLAVALGLPDAAVRERGPVNTSSTPRPRPSSSACLTAWLRDEHVLLSELRAGRRSLEDVFLRLTGEGRA